MNPAKSEQKATNEKGEVGRYDDVQSEITRLQNEYEQKLKQLEIMKEQYALAMEERDVQIMKAKEQVKDLHLQVVVPLYTRYHASKIYEGRLKDIENKLTGTCAAKQLNERIEHLENLVKNLRS